MNAKIFFCGISSNYQRRKWERHIKKAFKLMSMMRMMMVRIMVVMVMRMVMKVMMRVMRMRTIVIAAIKALNFVGSVTTFVSNPLHEVPQWPIRIQLSYKELKICQDFAIY